MKSLNSKTPKGNKLMDEFILLIFYDINKNQNAEYVILLYQEGEFFNLYIIHI